MKGARAHLHVIGLYQYTAVTCPELLEGKYQFLESPGFLLGNVHKFNPLECKPAIILVGSKPSTGPCGDGWAKMVRGGPHIAPKGCVRSRRRQAKRAIINDSLPCTELARFVQTQIELIFRPNPGRVLTWLECKETTP